MSARIRRTPTRAGLAAAALAYVDEAGPERLALTSLANWLGLRRAALKRHFPDDDALLDAVAGRLMASLKIPAPSADWRGWLVKATRAYRGLALAHPRAFVLVATRRFNAPESYRFVEAQLAVLERAGLTPERIALLFRTLGLVVNGAGMAEAAAELARRRGTPPVPKSVARGKRHARTQAIAPYLAAVAAEELFDRTVATILDTYGPASEPAKT